jgi:hypothetical protein
MAFPTSPINGETTIVNGIGYVYSSSTNSWTRAISPVGNLTISGNLFSDRVYTNTGLYWAGNNVPFTGQAGITLTTDTVAPPTPQLGDQWFDPVLGILFEYLSDGDSDQWVDISSPVLASNSSINLTAGDLTVLGHVSPGINQTYDLGNLSYKWRNVYVDDKITTGNITSTYGVFWANGKPGLYSNTAVSEYLPAYTGNLTSGNANIGRVTTTSGLFWSNGAPYTAGRQATSYGMNIIFGI